MIKNKLILGLFLGMMVADSKSKETKATEVKKKIERKKYYELLDKSAFLAAMANAQKTYDEAKNKTEEEKKKAQETLDKEKEAIEKKYNLKFQDIKETAEELKEKIKDSYPDLTYTDKGIVFCNKHWVKAAIITAAVAAIVAAYKYLSCDEDDTENEEEN